MSETDPVRTACERAQRLTDPKASRKEVLTCLAEGAEAVAAPGAVSSILFLGTDGLLRNGASPNVPQAYLEAIDRLRPDPAVGTCAAAAASGAVVVTRSFLAADKWAELRHLPLSLGFVGAWSMPVKSAADGRVLGTFGTYYRELRQPSTSEIAAVRALAASAALAIDQAAAL